MNSVSTITVCLNEKPDRIRYTMNSLVEQDCPDIERIVVDGGSDDETIRAFAAYMPHIAGFVSEPDNGIYDAMNKGIRAAKGEWIVVMNIGDRFHSRRTLKDMIGEAEIHGADLLFGKASFAKPRDLVTNHLTPRMKKWYFHRGFVCHQAVAVRKRAFEVTGLFDASYNLIGDREWFLRFIGSGLKSRSSDIVVCDWDIGGASSDYASIERERRKMIAAHYSAWENFLCEITWSAVRTWIRLKTGNFSIPVFLKDRQP